MASALAHLELLFLFVLTLCLALIPGIPVPRIWAAAAAVLTGVQTAAVRGMRIQPFEVAEQHRTLVHSVAEAVGLLVVPALTALLIGAVLWHLAAAYAFAHRRLQLSLSGRLSDRGG